MKHQTNIDVLTMELARLRLDLSHQQTMDPIQRSRHNTPGLRARSPTNEEKSTKSIKMLRLNDTWFAPKTEEELDDTTESWEQRSIANGYETHVLIAIIKRIPTKAVVHQINKCRDTKNWDTIKDEFAHRMYRYSKQIRTLKGELEENEE